MTKDEALKLALEALEVANSCIDGYYIPKGKTHLPEIEKAIIAIKEALAQPEQKPVAWLITDEKINSLQVDSIQRIIDRARHAHMTDIKLRINGQDEWFQADWLKHLTRTTLPEPWEKFCDSNCVWTDHHPDCKLAQRTWVGLMDAEVEDVYKIVRPDVMKFWRICEAKLKEKNT